MFGVCRAEWPESGEPSARAHNKRAPQKGLFSARTCHYTAGRDGYNIWRQERLQIVLAIVRPTPPNLPLQSHFDFKRFYLKAAFLNIFL